MIFFRKKTTTSLRSDEYEQLSNRITTLRSDLEEAKTKVRMLETEINNLRGNFNRKLSGIVKEEKKEEQPKALNTQEAKVFTGMMFP